MGPTAQAVGLDSLTAGAVAGKLARLRVPVAVTRTGLRARARVTGDALLESPAAARDRAFNPVWWPVRRAGPTRMMLA